MNLDQECKAAMSRVNYAINANAEWQKKLMAEKFMKPKEESKPRDDLREAYLRQMAAMQNNLNPYWGIRQHIQQAAHWNNPIANFGLLGWYR
jgi:hypothetical protein